MLRWTLMLALLAPGGARAQGDGDSVRTPEALTAGVSDQLLGQLAPDGQKLYFVSNRNTTNEIYWQDLLSGRAHLLFDEGADLTWPRLSPDGKRILYISYREDAAGALCVRDLPDKRRRCLAGAGSALQAQWIDKSRIILVARGAIDADLRVYVVQVGWRLSVHRLFDRNLSSPVVSPDGRWLVYVPLSRYLPRVGPGLASRAADRLEAVRLDRPGDPSQWPPQPLDADLPGLTGQPSFSTDGKWLYFTQFFNDTNQDGEIDGSDNGVLFRLPFESARDDAPARASKAMPEQLTDASWNCQYPAPSSQALTATCSRKNGLQVYRLPLDGQVPEEWSVERLRLELDLASRPVEELLLYRRLLEHETTVNGRRLVMMRLVRLHLAASEFVAAQFYAQKIKAQPDPATAGAASALLTLIEHRKAQRDRERGRLSLDFREQSRKRIESLAVDKIKNPAALQLRRVVRSEIEDALGDKEAARRELEAAPVEEVALPSFLDEYYRRADALYRELDDGEALYATCRRLAEHPQLSPSDRLGYARAAARALTRGMSWDAAAARLRTEQAKVAPDGELAFALELHQLLLTVREENVSWPLRVTFIDLYKKQTRFDRKRALVLDGVRRAAEREAEKLVEALSRLYVEDAPPGTAERKRAERLYERAMLGRAYRRLGRGDVARATEAFAELARTTNSFEAHVGYVDLLLRQGKSPTEIEALYGQKGAANEPSLHLVRGYLALRGMPALAGEKQAELAQRAMDELKKGGAPLRGQAVPEMVLGSIHHERYLDSGELAEAQRANVHYLLALDLVPRNPRYRALLLEQLALVQSQVGNYRIALGYADEREKLPPANEVQALAQKLLRARILAHVDRAEDALKAAEQAVALADATPSLEPLRPVALDRAALYALAANKLARAMELYQREVGLVDAAGGGRNKLAVRLGRAAAALGANQPRVALGDLDVVDQLLADPALVATLKWPHTPPDEVERGYKLIASGLRANAHLALHELDQAARALEIRAQLAGARLAKSGLDEHLRALALVEARLGDVARDRKRPEEAARWLSAALGHADDYLQKTGVPLTADQLDVLRLGAELSLSTGQKLKQELPARLKQAFDKMVSERDPAFRAHERWFEVYVALLGSPPSRSASLDNPATMAR